MWQNSGHNSPVPQFSDRSVYRRNQRNRWIMAQLVWLFCKEELYSILLFMECIIVYPYWCIPPYSLWTSDYHYLITTFTSTISPLITLNHYHAPDWQAFLDDLRACVEEVIANPGAAHGNAAIYGMTSSLPPGPVNDLLKVYNDVIFKL